ncbi:urease accessory UreF family protein, partial [Streptomyces sp. NPDC007084]|uniref:urease accessory protein UreF n=1 Tax=Streptomyces sp. NPDC007084 TaxID=3154313 RepID=UPI00345489B4
FGRRGHLDEVAVDVHGEAVGVDPHVGPDAAADARTPSLALRVAARRLGRQLMRAARATWPGAELDRLAEEFPKGAHQPVVLGVAARAAGLGPEDAAYCAAYEGVSGPASATVRLLSLDPFDATAVLARLAPELDIVAHAAASAARRVLDEGVEALPAGSAPLLEISAEAHAAWPVRLFAS